MIDAHCHLMDVKGYDIRASRVEKIVNCGYDFESSIIAIDLKKKFSDKLYCAVGVSPQKCMSENGIKLVELLSVEIENYIHTIDAIGEIGLDFHWAKTPSERKMQKELFIKQIRIAEEFGKPLIIHSRDAVTECLDALKGFDERVMFHFYSGSVKDAAKITDMGWYLSIPPVKGKNREMVIKKTDLSNLVAETDAPYVGKVPEDVIKSIMIISESKETEIEDIEKVTAQNVLSFLT